MKSTAAKVWLALLLLAVAAYGAYTVSNLSQTTSRDNAQYPSSQASAYGYEVGDFTLTDRHGEEFHARDLKGQVWVASFFFSECPGACVALNNHIAEMLKGDFADTPVRFVSISVDPATDTPEELDKYAAHYVEKNGIDPQRWIFLTDPGGKTDGIKAVSRQFKLSFGKLTHSDRMMLVDAEGRVQGSYQSSFPAEVQDLRRKLKKMTEHAKGQGVASTEDEKAANAPEPSTP